MKRRIPAGRGLSCSWMFLRATQREVADGGSEEEGEKRQQSGAERFADPEGPERAGGIFVKHVEALECEHPTGVQADGKPQRAGAEPGGAEDQTDGEKQQKLGGDELGIGEIFQD